MALYCSSPNCKNKCGKKENWEAAWRNPESIIEVLVHYEPLCDIDGNPFKLRWPSTNLPEISS
jgi:hypothetical protein